MAIHLLPTGAGPLGASELEDRYRPERSPWCRANFIVSLDGAVELDGRSGGLGGPDDRSVFAALRALADVVLVGSGTARAEDYGPARPDEDVRARRVERGQAPVPPIAVLTGRANLDPGAKLFTGDGDGPRPLVLTAEAAPVADRRALADVADVVVCGDGAVDLAAALDALRERGLADVLCEGGPTIVTRLLAGGLLDELCLTHAPVVAGPGHAGLTVGDAFDTARTGTRTHLLAGDQLLFGRYRMDQR